MFEELENLEERSVHFSSRLLFHRETRDPRREDVLVRSKDKQWNGTIARGLFCPARRSGRKTRCHEVISLGAWRENGEGVAALIQR